MRNLRDEERRIVDAAIAAVTWRNKVPIPGNVQSWNIRLAQLDDLLASAVMDYLGRDRWWAETYAPDGWPEDAA